MEYDIVEFKENKDLSVYARAISYEYQIEVEAEFYEEDGEEPIVLANVYLESFKSRSGEIGRVYIHTDNGEITENCIYEAINEFFLQ